MWWEKDELMFEFFEAIQMRRLLGDCKMLVDRVLKNGEEALRLRLETVVAEEHSRPASWSDMQLLSILDEQLDGAEFDQRPALLHAATDEIHDETWSEENRVLGEQLRAVWPRLAREALDRATPSTMLPLPRPYIVPGGRFREVYYWDTLWTLVGLTHSGLRGAAMDVLENLFFLVDRFGFVPNGARLYYQKRSHPPVLSEAVWVVAQRWPEESNSLIRKAYPRIVRELQLFQNPPYSVELDGWALSRYGTNSTRPRAESYEEDVSLVSHISSVKAKQDMWGHVASACESGWDFSSRWWADGTRESMAARSVVPVDLNVLLARAEFRAAQFARIVDDKDPQKAEEWLRKASRRRQAMDALMWDASAGMWRDLVLLDSERGADGTVQVATAFGYPPFSFRQSTCVAASNFFPLWLGPALNLDGDGEDAELAAEAANWRGRAEQAVRSLRTSGLILRYGVAATTCWDSGEQWDAPNVWPPLQWFLVHGLRRAAEIGIADALPLALDLAHGMVDSVRVGLASSNAVFEKYDGSSCGSRGFGGEYTVQEGFAWTIGVVLDFIEFIESSTTN